MAEADGNNVEKQARGLGNLRRVAIFMRPYRGRLILLASLTVCLACLNVLPPLVTRYLIDQVFTNRETEHFFLFGFLLLALPTTCHLMGFMQGQLITLLSHHFIFDIRFKLYQYMMRLSLRFFGKFSTGKLINRLMGDSSTIQQMLTGQTITIISDLFVASFAILATFVISWRLAIVLMLVLLVFVLNFCMNVHDLVETSRAVRNAMDRVSGGVQNRLVANLAVKTFGAEQREDTVFRGQSMEVMETGIRQGVVGNNFWMNVNMIQTVGFSILFFLGCGMVLSGDMTYGDVIAFTSYASQLLWPAVRFSQIANQLQQVSIATERLFEIFDEPVEIQDAPDAKPMPHLKGQVDFEHVKFHYVEGIEIIKDFSLSVKPGQAIALIGPTGCGKSTILNLILRYYDITGGSLKIDGVEMRDIRLKDLRRQCGVVLQESHLFSMSIRDNIRYGHPYATDEEVVAAAKAAEIHSFIEELPEKYDTRVGDFGVELSVGQKQRINIARAICADPAILIMDEATSSLDSESEHAIQLAIDKVLKGRTSFIVAHRLSTIKNADRILLLDKGFIQEQGTHEELMANPNGRYYDLYTKHMGKGVIEE